MSTNTGAKWKCQSVAVFYYFIFGTSPSSSFLKVLPVPMQMSSPDPSQNLSQSLDWLLAERAV